MKRSEKPFFVQNLTEELKSASSVVLADYSHLSVKMQQELKKRLKEAGAKMAIVKNSLFKLAGKNAKVDEEILSDTVLTGQTALIICEGDPITPLQVVEKFAKEYEVPQFKVGIVEGSFQDKDSLIKLANLPNKDILLGQVLGSLSFPMYGLVSTLQGNLEKLVYILQEKSKTG